MTAEIAILNKTAVALAADSAVTISAGSREEKIFDSADKLFELSHRNAIGVMIYNGTNFMEIPLPALIREFRSSCSAVKSVAAAAESFLRYLLKVGRDAPTPVKEDAIRGIAIPYLDRITERFRDRVQEAIMEAKTAGQIRSAIPRTMDEVISLFERAYGRRKDAEFIGGTPRFTRSLTEVLSGLVEEKMPSASDEQKRRLVALLKLILRKNVFSDRLTGIVIAGFGSGDIFPTLVSYELDGMIGSALKHRRSECVDIDRAGPRARVLPFAQKEMVDRFLYGLDEEIQRRIRVFCTTNIHTIREQIFDSIEFESDEARIRLEALARAAEGAFLSGLGENGFGNIRSVSRAEIEDMVEFMPKPELAKMAEALVNLTSIKRRVSRGMETVGGPIDVAVISASEGFVWVKRKHYFPAELNTRYFERMKTQLLRTREPGDDAKEQKS